MTPKRYTQLSQDEQATLIRFILEFFQPTTTEAGKFPRDLRKQPEMQEYHPDDLNELMRSMARTHLLWKRGRRGSTVYATSALGELVIDGIYQQFDAS